MAERSVETLLEKYDDLCREWEAILRGALRKLFDPYPEHEGEDKATESPYVEREAREYRENMVILRSWLESLIRSGQAETIDDSGDFMVKVHFEVLGRRLIPAPHDDPMGDAIWNLHHEYVDTAVKDWIRYLQAPALTTGRKVVAGGQRGHTKTYGDPAEKQRRWREWQAFILSEHKRYPRLSYNALSKKAADKYGVTQRTIKAHTKASWIK